ncbi:hypothetical protein AB0K20_23165 [Micromonospora matsumotoense]|uniref:hypothetical protein n=1 Tax=Micromonospora matsumotoense TaxID=121616 RepID=UPI0034316D79
MTTDRIPNPQPLTYGTVQPGTLIQEASAVFRVAHTVTWRDEAGAEHASLTVVPVGQSSPDLWSERADCLLRLASEEAVAEAVARAQRAVLVSGLGLIADRVRSHVLSVSAYGARVSLRVATPVELYVWADAFGTEVREVTHEGRVHRSVSVELGDDDTASLELSVSCPSALVEPEPAPLPEHRHVAGSTGSPGEWSAECACGVTFAGFDTLGEAVAVLDRHIANPAPADTTGGDR